MPKTGGLTPISQRMPPIPRKPSREMGCLTSVFSILLQGGKFQMKKLLLILSLTTIAFAQKWEYLGEANVDGAIDHDRITVTAAKGEYRAIQIRVEKGAIKFDHVVVHFGNGASDPIYIRARINAG